MRNEQNFESERLDFLDGWRTISVGLVILRHLFVFSNFATEQTETSLFAEFGDLGVQIFFIISGYVICRGFLKELQSHSSVSLKGFYIRRFVRIFPPLYAYISTILVLTFLSLLPKHNSDISHGYVFVCNLPTEFISCGGYLGLHLYSLSFEEQFYLMFPLVFLFAVQSHTLRFLSYICLSLPMLAFIALRLDKPYLAYYLFCMSFIAMGVAAAILETRILKVMTDWKAIHFTLACAIVVVLSLRHSVAFLETLYLLFMPALILIMLFASLHNSSVMRFLTQPVITLIGRSSYSIYLWQQLATRPFEGLEPYWSLVFVAMAIIGGMLSYKYLEYPLIMWTKKSLQKSQPLPVQQTV